MLAWAKTPTMISATLTNKPCSERVSSDGLGSVRGGAWQVRAGLV